MVEHKPRIAWFSPLNCGVPGSSTCAYVSDQLLPILSRDFEIDLFHDSFEQYKDLPTYHYLSAFRHDRDNPYDLFFYQVEDSKAADFCRMHLGLLPGVVLFHDFIMRTRGPVSLVESPWVQTISEFNKADLQDLSSAEPLAWREAAFSPVALFSDPRSLDEFRRKISLRMKAGQTETADSFYLPLPAGCSRQVERSGDVFTVCTCAGVEVEHRAHKLLLALSQMKSPARLIWMVDQAEEGVARELLSEYGFGDGCLIAGKSPEKWAQVVREADVAVHTLFSAYGQCGPWLQISLMAGLPALITDFGSADYWPESLLFKIEPGENEAVEIRSVLEKLSGSDLRAHSAGARSYASCEFAAPKVARELSEVFIRAIPAIKSVRSRWNEIAARGKKNVVNRSLEEKQAAQGAAFSLRHHLLGPVYKEFGWLERRVKEKA